MRKLRHLPSQDELRRIFDYDPDRGVLVWRHRADRRVQWNSRFAGKVAGGPSHKFGYWVVVLIGLGPVLAHRLIWKWLYNEEPPSIDHIDGDQGNNRAENLRAASHTQNMRNKKPHRGKLLPKGVSESSHGKSYRASIYLNGRCVHLGCFSDPKTAHAAYCKAATNAYGDFARVA